MEVGFPVAHGMFFDNRCGASRQFFCTIPTLQPDHRGALAPAVTRILGRKQLNGVNFVKGNSSSEREGVRRRPRGFYTCCMVMICGKRASSRPVSPGASAVLTFSNAFRCRLLSRLHQPTFWYARCTLPTSPSGDIFFRPSARDFFTYPEWKR